MLTTQIPWEVRSDSETSMVVTCDLASVQKAAEALRAVYYTGVMRTNPLNQERILKVRGVQLWEFHAAFANEGELTNMFPIQAEFRKDLNKFSVLFYHEWLKQYRRIKKYHYGMLIA